MFMDCNGPFSSIWREKKTSMYYESLFMSYGINHGFYERNIKFVEFHSFYCVQ